MRTHAYLLLILCSCSGFTPQAAFDYFDWIRNRNEKAIYRDAIESVEELGAPYCDLLLDEKDYPLTFAVFGLKQSRYLYNINVVEYPLGDHERMSHEMVHAVLYRGSPTEKCLQQVAATAISRNLYKNKP